MVDSGVVRLFLITNTLGQQNYHGNRMSQPSEEEGLVNNGLLSSSTIEADESFDATSFVLNHLL